MTGEPEGTGGEIVPAEPSLPKVADEPAGPDWSGNLPAALTAQWEGDAAGYEYRHAVAAGHVSQILGYLAPEERLGLESHFELLPSDIQTTILANLALDNGGSVSPANASEVAEFAEESEAGARLVAHWGNRAARNLGRCQQRIALIVESLPEKDRDFMLDWFLDLPTRAMVAVCCTLAAD